MTRHLLSKEGKRHTHEEVHEIRESYREAKAEHEATHGAIAPAHQRHRAATVEMHEKNRDAHVAGLKQSLKTIVTHAEPEAGEREAEEGAGAREGGKEASRDAQEIEIEHEHELEQAEVEAAEGANGGDHTPSYKKRWGEVGGEEVPMAVLKEGPAYAHG